MKKYILLLVILIGFCNPVKAVDAPHDTLNSINCDNCHVPHSTLGDILINATDSLVSTLCISCHTPGGWVAMSKILSSSQKADPGVSGTSHSWDVPAVNAERGTQLPSDPDLLDHLRADNKITCATCHDPHANSISPFLRKANTANALCLSCHQPRNMDSVDSLRTYTGTDRSHPISVSIPVSATYHSTPYDVDGNPQPSDGNTTNDLALDGGVIRCTTCHGVHYTDSNSGTVDGP
jgi:predicted CXXCH cytochrome family protein